MDIRVHNHPHGSTWTPRPRGGAPLGASDPKEDGQPMSLASWGAFNTLADNVRQVMLLGDGAWDFHDRGWAWVCFV